MTTFKDVFARETSTKTGDSFRTKADLSMIPICLYCNNFPDVTLVLPTITSFDTISGLSSNLLWMRTWAL